MSSASPPLGHQPQMGIERERPASRAARSAPVWPPERRYDTRGMASTMSRASPAWRATVSTSVGSATSACSHSSRVIWSIRIPRLLAAALLGGALSVSGFLLQTFFANPIAGPFVLGVSSGAKLTVALTMIFCLGRGILLSAAGMVATAFVGSLFAMGFVLLAAGRLRGMSRLIVCGVMIGYICSAVTDIVVTFADDSNIVNLHNWSMGSFSGIGWSDVGTASAAVLFAMACAVLLSKPMNAYQLGEAYADLVQVVEEGLEEPYNEENVSLHLPV